MGCCVSSNRTSTTTLPSSLRKDHDYVAVAQPPKSSTSREKKASEKSRAPPQAEEETVKEVLSETPKWKNPTIAKSSKPQKPHQNMTFDKFKEEKSKLEKKALPIKKAEEDTSEVSEACSFSETMSTTTVADDTEETCKRVNGSPARLQKNRSFSGDLGGRRERTVHGSRNVVGSVRTVQCRDQMGQKMAKGGTVRNQQRRRDPGENPVRRSRSPAATRADAGAARSVMGRSPSVGRANLSPATVTTSPPENGCRKIENPAVGPKGPSANESLENPLVSLECFIFI